MGMKRRKFKSHEEIIVSIKFQNSNQVFASYSKDGNLRVYNLLQSDCIFDIMIGSGEEASSSSSPENSNSIISNNIFWPNNSNIAVVVKNSIVIVNLLEKSKNENGLLYYKINNGSASNVYFDHENQMVILGINNDVWRYKINQEYFE